MKLWIPVDKTKQGGYIAVKGKRAWTPPGDLGDWRLATKRERLWWEISHSRWSLLDVAAIVALMFLLRFLLGG